MLPTTIIKIKSALLILVIHLIIAILADLWLDMQLYAPLGVSGTLLYMQIVNNLKKKQQQETQQ